SSQSPNVNHDGSREGSRLYIDLENRCRISTLQEICFPDRLSAYTRLALFWLRLSSTKDSCRLCLSTQHGIRIKTSGNRCISLWKQMKWFLMILILVWSPLTIAQQYSATEDDISDLLDDIVAVPDQEMDY